jgi:hypothetical protein
MARQDRVMLGRAIFGLMTADAERELHFMDGDLEDLSLEWPDGDPPEQFAFKLRDGTRAVYVRSLENRGHYEYRSA